MNAYRCFGGIGDGAAPNGHGRGHFPKFCAVGIDGCEVSICTIGAVPSLASKQGSSLCAHDKLLLTRRNTNSHSEQPRHLSKLNYKQNKHEIRRVAKSF